MPNCCLQLVPMLAYNLYDNLQSAYRPQQATETVVLKIQNDIVSLDNGKCTVLASLDLSAAFDTVDHSIFIARIQQPYGVDSVCKDWFESYLQDRSHSVCINDTLSDQNALKCGVPQGSVLVQDCIACMRTHSRTSLRNIIDSIIHMQMILKFICNVRIMLSL